jgi:hypothetical protein
MGYLSCADGVGIKTEGDSRSYRKGGRAQRADWHRPVNVGDSSRGTWPTGSGFERFYGTMFWSRSGGKWT